ncbi:MAG TPA: hypothetical protein V6C97_32920 [Oculatellaceae cyanobacterium]
MGEVIFWVGLGLFLIDFSVRVWKRADKMGLLPGLVRGVLVVFLMFVFMIVIDVVNNRQP